MTKTIAICIIFCFCSISCRLETPKPTIKPAKKFDYSLYKEVLTQYVKDGLVNYKKLHSNLDKLQKFISSLKSVGPTLTPKIFKTKASKLAFWINSYNAIGLYQAAKKYPCKSVNPILGNFETQTTCWVDGRKLTLKQIKQLALKESNFDPRVYLALKLPAKGTGKLPNEPFDPERLENQLNNIVNASIDDKNLLFINHQEKQLELGKPFWQARDRLIKQYKEKFKVPYANIINALGMYANFAQRRRLNTAIEYNIVLKPFDWTLNDRSKPECVLDKLKDKKESKE